MSGHEIMVPCGKCTACRIKRATEWKFRLLAELPYWNYNAVFLTLTYDDEHLPLDRGLQVEDLKKFWKRLRKDLVNDGRYHLDKNNKKVADLKYYACGEYGDTTLRPHYHAIVYGLDYCENDRQLVIDNWQLCDSLRFKKSSGNEKGFAPVSADDIGYVTGYIQKKLSGNMADEVYGDRKPPFSVSSRGLGLRWAEDNAERLQSGVLTMNGNKITIPRYYIKKLGIDQFSENYQKRLHAMCDFIIQTCGQSFNRFLIDALGSGRFDLIETKYHRLLENSNAQLELNLKAKMNKKGLNYEI